MAFPTLPLWIVLPVVLVAVYFLGVWWPPFGVLLAFLCRGLGQVLLRTETLLEVFKNKLTGTQSTFIGLHTVTCLVALFFALIVLAADAGNNFAALTALYGGSVAIPSMPAVFNLAMGALFLACPALLGMCWLEVKEVIPEEARIFTLLQEHSKGWFNRLVTLGLWLSIPDVVLYYALKPLFLANPDSGLVVLLQFLINVILGVVLPLVSILSLYIVALGIQTLVALFLGFLWFVVSAVTDVLDFLSLYFTDPNKKDTNTKIQGVRPVVTVIEAAPAPVLDIAQPALTTEVLAASQAVLDTIISDVVPVNVKPAPYPGRTRDHFPISGSEQFVQLIRSILDELQQKVPQFYELVLEYLSEARQDVNILTTHNALGLSDGRLAFDESTPYHTARHVLLHEAAHVFYMHHHNNREEDAANDFAAMVVAKIQSWDAEHGNE